MAMALLLKGQASLMERTVSPSADHEHRVISHLLMAERRILHLEDIRTLKVTLDHMDRYRIQKARTLKHMDMDRIQKGIRHLQMGKHHMRKDTRQLLMDIAPMQKV